MRRRRNRWMVLAVAVPVAVAGWLSVSPGAALANPNQTMTMSYNNSTQAVGDVGGVDVGALEGGFANIAIPYSGTVTNNAGNYRAMANFWNPATVISGRTNPKQTITLDDQTGAFH